MKKYFLVFLILFFSCSINNFNVKKDNEYFGLKFYIFVSKDDDVFKGKGEGFLSEKVFFCNVNDLLLNKKIVSMLFNEEGLKAYIYPQEMGYFIDSRNIGEFFSKDFFYLFKSGELSLQKEVFDNEQNYSLLKVKVIKTQNNFPKRISFQISSLEEEINILLDLYELNDKNYNLKFDIDISEFYKYNIFEFFRSIQ